jgi:hypothetical protein
VQQTLPTYRDPRVAPHQPLYENPRYVAPIPPLDPWSRPPRAGYVQLPPRPMPTPAPRPQPLSARAPRPPAPPVGFAREFDFKPRRDKRRGWWIGAAVAGALAAMVIATIVTLTTADRSDSTSGPGLITAGKLTPDAPPPQADKSDPSTDEAALDRLVEDFRAAADLGPTSNWRTFYCAADREVLERAAVTSVIVPSKNFDRSSPLTDVEVTGQRARGELNGSLVKFRKETGDWKFCMTA